MFILDHGLYGYSPMLGRGKRERVDDRMRIRVSYFGFLRLKLNMGSEDLQVSKGAKIRDLFLHLADRYGEQFKMYVFDPHGAGLKRDILVNINDAPIRQKGGLETELNNGDRIDILPLFTGGG